MIVLIARYKVKTGHVEQVITALRRMTALMKEQEPGCTMYQVCQAHDDPDALLLYEQYVDEAAVAAHRETPFFKEIVEGTIVPLLDKRERTFYDLVIE